MENYRKIDKIGEGTYGKVYMARDRRNEQTVALKKIQLHSGIGGMPSTLIREMALLRQTDHENIIKLLDIQSSDHNMYLIFEYLECDLAKYVDKFKDGLSQTLVKNYMNQLLKGLAYCHSHRIIHRDLKPQNLLVSSKGIIKIADFGLSRYVGISSEEITNEVMTLWYRSPEVLLGTKLYLFGVDIWSLACIFVEMSHKMVLFKGDSEIDQLFKIFRIMGTPGDKLWPSMASLPHFNVSFPKWLPQNLKLLLPNFNDDALDLLQEMLVYNSKSRISANQALNHKYFKDQANARSTASYVTLL